MISRSITCAELFRSSDPAVSGFVLLSPVFLYGGVCLLRVWKSCSLDTNRWRLDHGDGFHRKGSYVHYRFISFIVWVEEPTLIRAQKLDARNCDAVLITKRVWGFFLLLCVCIAQLQNILNKNVGAQSESVSFIHSWLLFLPRHRWTFVCCCSFIFRKALYWWELLLLESRMWVYVRTSQILEWHRTDHSAHHPMKLSIISVRPSVWRKLKLVGHRDKACLMSHHHA